MKYQFKYIVAFFLGMILFYSCEDVIELDLETTESRVVIESFLDAGTGEAKVYISKTNDFYDNSLPEMISGAEISIQDSESVSYGFIESSPGIYVVQGITADPGDSFSLTVETNGESYEANAIVPVPVSLDSISVFEFGGNPFGGDDDLALSAYWDDPEGMENFYRIRAFVDGEFQADNYTVVSDGFTGDGTENVVTVSGFEANTSVT